MVGCSFDGVETNWRNMNFEIVQSDGNDQIVHLLETRLKPIHKKNNTIFQNTRIHVILFQSDRVGHGG